jgi:acid phosphatase class B
MRRLASNMADGYCNKEFWRDLETSADEFGIPKKN